MLPFDDLTLRVFAYDNDRGRANHLLKVCAYAMVLAGREKLPQRETDILRAAAILHDIGIKASLEKYDSCAGPYQQQEGPPVARELLAGYGLEEAFVERVCWLIAHHHEYVDIRERDHQLLIEADFLVNCDEGRMGPKEIASIKKRVFRTQAGRQLLDLLFGSDEEGITEE